MFRSTVLLCRRIWRISPLSTFPYRGRCRTAFTFSAHDGRAGHVHAACPKICGCEAYKANPKSPGRVKDGEILHLLVSDPQHRLPTGEINPVLAEQIDRGGLSVLRQHAADDEFLETIEELKAASRGKGRERYLHGVMSFKASTIRSVGSTRFMCVYDTALPRKPNHADIMAPSLPPAVSKKEGVRAQRARTKQLIELIGSGFESAGDFREGLLLSYARPRSAPSTGENGAS